VSYPDRTSLTALGTWLSWLKCSMAKQMYHQIWTK